MTKSTFQASIPGMFLIILIALFLGIIVGMTLINRWNISTNDAAALIVAIIALSSSIFYSWSQRRHNRLQVRPKIVINSDISSVDEDGYYSFYIRIHNYGLGPALITNTEVSFEGNPVAEESEFVEWIRLVNKILPTNGKAMFHSESANKNDILDKSTSVKYLAFHTPVNDIKFLKARELFIGFARKITISVEYESMYEDKYKAEFNLKNSNN